MPFIPLSSSMLRNWVGEPALRVYCERGEQHTRLGFCLSKPLLDQMGWQPHDRLVVSLGTGEDAGAFRISRGDRAGEGIRLGAFGRLAWRIKVPLPRHFFGVDTAALIEGVAFPLLAPFEVVANALVFRLPRASGEVVALRTKPPTDKSLTRARKVRA